MIIDRKVLVYLSAFFSFAVMLAAMTSSWRVGYPDSCFYIDYAKEIMTGNFSFDFISGKTTVLPPLYSISVAILSFLTQNAEVSGVLVSAFAGGLIIIPVFYISRTIFDKKAAYISTILVILNPALIHWSGTIMTEAIFTFFYTASVAAGMYAFNSKKKIWFIITGAMIALAFLARVPGILAILAILLWVVIFYLVKKISIKNALIFICLIMVGFSIIAGPYLFYLRNVFGYWNVTASYASITRHIVVEGAEKQAGEDETDKTEESYLDKFMQKIGYNLRIYSGALLWMFPVGVFVVLVGLVLQYREFDSGNMSKSFYVISFVIVYFVMLLIVPASPFFGAKVRYLSPILPLLMVMASGGIIHITEWINKARISNLIILSLTAVVVSSSMLPAKILPLKLNRFWINNGSVDIQEKFALDIKNNLKPPLRIMSRKPFVAYYADATWFRTPYTYNEVLKLSNSKKVDYIVVHRAIDYYTRPELRFLFDPKQSPEELQFMDGIWNSVTNELEIGIYKIRGESAAVKG